MVSIARGSVREWLLGILISAAHLLHSCVKNKKGRVSNNSPGRIKGVVAVQFTLETVLEHAAGGRAMLRALINCHCLSQRPQAQSTGFTVSGLTGPPSVAILCQSPMGQSAQSQWLHTRIASKLTKRGDSPTMTSSTFLFWVCSQGHDALMCQWSDSQEESR